MVTYNLTGILYSNKNYSLEFELNSICKKRNIFLTTSTDFIELTIKNAELKPQFVFCDCETIEFDEYKMNAFLSNQEFKTPKIVFIDKEGKISSQVLAENMQICANMDIKSIIDKHIHKFDSTNFVTGSFSSNINQLNNDIYDLLSSLGFSVKYLGYNYLCDCIKNVILNNGIIRSLSTVQYVYTATKFKTNVANVERNIRNVITETWKKFGNTWYNFLHSKSLEIGLKPTNREFINMCSQIITIKAKYKIKSAGL